MTQSLPERILSFFADNTGICWLALVLWWDHPGLYNPLKKCPEDCDYCGKKEHAMEAQA